MSNHNGGLKPLGSPIDPSRHRDSQPCPCTPNDRNGPMKPDRPDEYKGYKPFSDR